MVCREARYSCFRNIISGKIVFSDGINMIYGDNAEGKTNALEGIYLCAQGRSHRTVHEKEFINFDSEAGGVTVGYDDRYRKNEISMSWSREGKRCCEHNGVRLARLSEFIGRFRAVLFTPEHLSIVKDGPSKRRLFLDGAISQLEPRYVQALQRYNRILIQRNRLLLEAQHSPSSAAETIGVWSEQLSAEAEIISGMRSGYVEKLNGIVGNIFAEMTDGREKPLFEYSSSTDRNGYLEMLTSRLDREIRYGATLFGPHKEDIGITLNGRDARSFASQGQQRSLSLAMKIAEGEISKLQSGEYPVFLLDDVMSELDEGRKRYITGGMSGRQVILTACDKNGITGCENIIYAKNGTYRQ